MASLDTFPRKVDRLLDVHGGRITYVGRWGTDRCELGCRYCMAETMSFMPRHAILSLEEIATVADAFIDRGVRKIRLTGGEPLARRGAVDLARNIGRRLNDGLDGLTLAADGTALADPPAGLAGADRRRG